MLLIPDTSLDSLGDPAYGSTAGEVAGRKERCRSVGGDFTGDVGGDSSRSGQVDSLRRQITLLTGRGSLSESKGTPAYRVGGTGRLTASSRRRTSTRRAEKRTHGSTGSAPPGDHAGSSFAGTHFVSTLSGQSGLVLAVSRTIGPLSRY